MKNIISLTKNFSAKQKNNPFNFSQAGLSNYQLAAIKGGDDIIITDIIGSNNGDNNGNNSNSNSNGG